MMISFKRDQNSDAPLLNFRVDDLEGLVRNLKKLNIEFISEIQRFDYGKFLTFQDPFENQIELWEATEDVYKRMVKKELDTYKKTHKD